MRRVESVPEVELVNAGMQSVEEEKILEVSPNPEDHTALCEMAAGRCWKVRSVSTCRDALARLAAERVTVIFCDDVLEDGTWRDLLKLPGTETSLPLLVVTSRHADASLWAEVLNLGGYDVLLKPFTARDVVHVLRNISLQASQKNGRTKVAGAI